MNRARLQELAGILTEARYTQSNYDLWFLIDFDSYKVVGPFQSKQDAERFSETMEAQFGETFSLSFGTTQVTSPDDYITFLKDAE